MMLYFVAACDQGMQQLDIQVIDLVGDPHHAADEEDKISSSSARKRLLGTLLRPPLKVSCVTLFICHYCLGN